jgi:hypothetical protein
MCTTCVSTASQAASWGPPALAAGAAAVLTGVRTRFPGRGGLRSGAGTATTLASGATGPTVGDDHRPSA